MRCFPGRLHTVFLQDRSCHVTSKFCFSEKYIPTFQYVFYQGGCGLVWLSIPSCASSIDCFLSSSRLKEHSSPYLLHPSLVLYLAHSRRPQQSQEEFVHIPSMYLRQAGLVFFAGWADTFWSFALGSLCRLLQKPCLSRGKEIELDFFLSPSIFHRA